MNNDTRRTESAKGSTASRAKSKGEAKPPKSEALKTVEGVVVAEGTRTGIAGLQVFLHADATGDGPRIGAAITDKDGKFAIRHRVTVQSIEISTSDATDSVVRAIPKRLEGQLRLELTAEELSRLLPRRDAERKEREDKWEREALIRREVAHARGLKVIERLERRRKFGAKIASQISLSTVPAETREEDRSYVEPGASAKDQMTRLLEVGRKGVTETSPKSRAVKLEAARIEELQAISAERGAAPLDSILGVCVRPTTPPVDPSAQKILEELRERTTTSQEPPSTVDPPGDDTDVEEPEQPLVDEEGSPAPYVRDAVERLLESGRGVGLPVGSRGDQDSVATEITGVNMGRGPADVTSYHEFRNVRIAFDPLWTEYFDPAVAKMVEKVLGGLEHFKDDLPFTEITALEALEPFLTIADELADLGEPPEYITPPDDVKQLLPGLTPADYTSLPPSIRTALDELVADYEAVKAAIQGKDPFSGVGLPEMPWDHFDPATDPAPAGNWQRDDTNAIESLDNPMPDFWMIWGGDRIRFNHYSYISRQWVLNTTSFDVYPGTPQQPTIWTRLQSGERCIKAKNHTAMLVDGITYVKVASAQDRAKMHFESEARRLVQPVSAPQTEGGGDDGDDSGEVVDAPVLKEVGSNVEALAEILSGIKDYRFKVFSPGSVNFGILLKYRQAWEPQNYQVGDLIRTIPLAPKESRRFKKRLVIKKSRSQKEIESALQTRSDAEEHTGRTESEIVRRAQNATNFEATAEGKGGIGVVEFGGSATAGASAQEENTKNKRKMRQAVQKAAHEYKQERRIEISTLDSEELESSESGEITNPNEEITVTYLFYELQKRFFVNERLVDIEPIVLVAHDVPLPSEITESWLIRHDWILKRVLLDDSFLETFKLLEESNKARDILVGVLRDDLRRKRAAFEEIKEQVATNLRVKNMATAALKEAIRLRIDAINNQQTTAEEAGDVALTIFTGGLFGSQGLLGVGGTAGQGDFEKPEAAEARQEASEEMLARTAEEARRLRSLLEGAEVALDRAIEKYSEAVRGRFNKELAVLRLRNHIAQNILHYMQAIWEYEPPDQRFFRLYDIRVPVIGGEVGVDVGDNEVTLTFSSEGIGMSDPGYKPLRDLADLDSLIGYKGNYMMFPLREHNYLTAWMIQDYLDGSGHVQDPNAHEMPDPGMPLQAVGNELMTLQTMSVELNNEITKAQTMPNWEDIRPAYEAAKSALRQKIQLEQSKFADVVVPTDLLFIEALPGKHPLLEDFKLVHRSLDVEKVAAERDALKLENIRRTARLLKGDYEDPEIDRSISVEGTPTSVITEI